MDVEIQIIFNKTIINLDKRCNETTFVPSTIRGLFALE